MDRVRLQCAQTLIVPLSVQAKRMPPLVHAISTLIWCAMEVHARKHGAYCLDTLHDLSAILGPRHALEPDAVLCCDFLPIQPAGNPEVCVGYVMRRDMARS